MTSSTTFSNPTASPLPISHPRVSGDSPAQQVSSSAIRQWPHTFPLPKLRLEARDLIHAGSRKFFSSINAAGLLEAAVQSVFNLLYTASSKLHPCRSVTLILRPMSGIAYTTGSDLDNDHKEIHFSLDYINGLPEDRVKAEILGVIRHEMVHCLQYNGFDTCPGGLIEGIADYVRLRSGFVPAHWRKTGEGQWDAGYQTTGYFLDWLETNIGEGCVRRMNEELRVNKYEEKAFWIKCCGMEVEELWKVYGAVLEQEKSNH